MVLGFDAPNIPLYGQEPERFFLGVSDAYCDLPLSIFAKDQLLGVRLRPSNPDAAEGSLAEILRIVGHLRTHWPEVKIVLQADSGLLPEVVDKANALTSS
ncbi:transposase [Methylacidimicrobium sp. B4]|uniref:transposase n=1 Tax=Methylacidimicrobium sp. B4 TaxID=2796139 RepID=UPI002104CF1F|nr:transposase [Methylacidimicrobium sp. B4]